MANSVIRMAKKSLLPITIGGLAAIVAFIGAFSLMQGVNRSKQETAALFWNGYAKLYYEQSGSWDGIQQQLTADKYMLAENRSLELTVYDANGAAMLAESSERSSTRGARKVPVLSQGIVVGYTQAAIAVRLSDYFLIVVVTLVVFSLMCGAGLYVNRRMARATNKSANKLSSAVLGIISAKDADGRSEPISGEASPVMLLHAVSALAAKAQKLETVRKTMVADIAHELRTPISIMRAQLDNAIQEGEALPLAKTVALHDETLRLTRLVRDLQELSLAESGNLPLQKSWFSLSALADSVLETLAVEAEERQLSTTIEKAKDIRVYADETRIRQIVINLIGNGLEHARGSLRIEVDVQDGFALLAVSDDGWGMEEEELKRVFERFYRGQGRGAAARKSAGLGLGLGLAIAYQFALAHNGAITASSRWNEGAVFTLRLPVIAS